MDECSEGIRRSFLVLRSFSEAGSVEGRTSGVVKVSHKRYIKGSKKRLRTLGGRRGNLQIAEQICALRTKAGLSQNRLADLVGTTQSVISRLESADYSRHSLTMLKKIGAVLHQCVQVRFIPKRLRHT